MSDPNGRLVHRPAAGGAAAKAAAGPLIHVEPILVRRPEAARLLSVSQRKFDEWVAAGLIARWKFGGSVFFTVDELRRFVKAAESATAPEFQRYLAAQSELARERKKKKAAGNGRRPLPQPPELSNG